MEETKKKISDVQIYLGVGFVMSQIYLFFQEPFAWVLGAALFYWFDYSVKSAKDKKAGAD